MRLTCLVVLPFGALGLDVLVYLNYKSSTNVEQKSNFGCAPLQLGGHWFVCGGVRERRLALLNLLQSRTHCVGQVSQYEYLIQIYLRSHRSSV